MPKTKSRPARPVPTEHTSRRPRLHAAARDEPQTVVQAATPQALSSPVEQSAPQAPTTSVCTIPVTEPPSCAHSESDQILNLTDTHWIRSLLGYP